MVYCTYIYIYAGGAKNLQIYLCIVYVFFFFLIFFPCSCCFCLITYLRDLDPYIHCSSEIVGFSRVRYLF